jgi:beta-glucosidase
MTIPAVSPGHLADERPPVAGPLSFPQDFLWGAATAAYQIEGAAREDGRGPSIWDTFSRTPGKVRDGDTGDVAADHYHRWRQDVALMRELGLRSYRFSVAWPRIQPDGVGPADPRGLDFYSRLVDALLEAGIVPVLTLYHWDLPQALQDAGGWPARDTAYRFADYSLRVFEALGDRVPYWMTLNEPWCSAFLGYGNGLHAPGVSDHQQSVEAVHHLLLGHGLAVRAMRAAGRKRALFGIVLNPTPVSSASQRRADVRAARLADGMQNRIFLDAILKGSYPQDVLEDLARSVDLSHIRDGDQETIAAPIDVLGINYYQRFTVGARSTQGVPWERPPSPQPSWPGADRIAVQPHDGPRTAMGWGVDADGLLELLLQIHRRYGPIPMLITENGAAYDDDVDKDGQVRDLDRIGFLDQHVRAAWRAIQAGIDLRGYFVWSLLDNFEWAEGYSRRFGLIYVDYPTQRRFPKHSAAWYRRVIEDNGLLESGTEVRGPRTRGMDRPIGLHPTLEEVGAAAGVSRATVSRVINSSPKVSPLARQAVERAIAELGYVPNRAARSLVTRRTETIALVVSEPEARVFADPFFSAVVRGVSAAVSHTELQLVLLMAQGEREHEKVERFVRQGHVDGVALLSLHGEDPLPYAMASAGVPTVLLGRPQGEPGIAYVDADNRGGARQATEHMLSRGRRSIATITGPQDMSAGIDRYEGYADALQGAGVEIRKGLVEAGDFSEDSGYQAMSRLLSRGADIDAVFAGNDLMAAGALRALQAGGRRVPGDVAVVGFDDAPLARHTSPPLTTVRQPLDQMTGAMADLLLKQIEGGVALRDQVICPTTLVLRESA